MKSSGNTSVARLVCDEATARRVADLLSESLEAAETAIAAFEGAGGQWTVEVHFEAPPDETALRALVGSVTGAALDVRDGRGEGLGRGEPGRPEAGDRRPLHGAWRA